MKEQIGLGIQLVAFLLLVFIVQRRQLHDLFIQENDKATQFTKNVLFGSTLVVTLMCSVGLLRLLYIVSYGHTTWFFDQLSFWSNRVLYIVNAVVGVILYRNKRQV